jgi:hypothetical protein
MSNQTNTFIPIPGGDVTVRVNGTAVKTYGETIKHGIMDANYVDQNYAYGAFPRPEESAPTAVVPNARKK